MTTNTNHPTSSLSFTLLHLPFIYPLFSSPNSYKNVVNRSKKAFFNYLPVSNTVTIRLPNITEIRTKNGKKTRKNTKKIPPEIHPQSQCWSTVFTDLRNFSECWSAVDLSTVGGLGEGGSTPYCHSERSEESLPLYILSFQILRFSQNDVLKKSLKPGRRTWHTQNSEEAKIYNFKSER